MVHKWFNEFRCSHTTTNNAERPESTIVVTTENIINKIHDVVLADRQVKIREIADEMHTSNERVFHILQDILGLQKLSARWVPRLFTVD